MDVDDIETNSSIHSFNSSFSEEDYLTDEQLLSKLYEERKRIVTRKAAAARLIARAGSSADQAKNGATYQAAEEELRVLSIKIQCLEESLKELAALETPSPLVKNADQTPAPAPIKRLHVTDDMPRFFMGTNAREFLDAVKHIASAYV
ncbi:hypothetical protein BGX28_001857, partial [Mortierella sp. GBA30]